MFLSQKKKKDELNSFLLFNSILKIYQIQKYVRLYNTYTTEVRDKMQDYRDSSSSPLMKTPNLQLIAKQSSTNSHQKYRLEATKKVSCTQKEGIRQFKTVRGVLS